MRSVGLQESLLQNILGVLAVAGDIHRQPVDIAVVLIDQRREGLAIAPPRLLDQFGLVFQMSGHLSLRVHPTASSCKLAFCLSTSADGNPVRLHSKR
jgi:hypothetical protein